MVVPTVPGHHGHNYLEERVVGVEEEVEADMLLAGDERTAKVLTEGANSFIPYLLFTYDCPYLQTSGWMLQP